MSLLHVLNLLQIPALTTSENIKLLKLEVVIMTSRSYIMICMMSVINKVQAAKI